MTPKQLPTVAICVALTAGVFLIFGQTIRHDFINVDDNHYVTQNPQVTRGLTWDGVRWAFTEAHAANWHPLTWLSHMLDGQLHGLRPAGHHFTNVLLHAANAALLFLMLQGLTGAVWPAVVVAALFAFHPLRVESVAWVAERKDVLSGLFFILTLWAYACYALARTENRKPKTEIFPSHAPSLRSPLFYLLAFAFFALGLMSKPMLVTLPFVLLLLDYWPLDRAASDAGRASGRMSGAAASDILPASRNTNHASRFAWLVVEKTPLFALAAASSALTLWAQGQVGAVKTASEISLPWRLANAAVSYVTYIRQMIFPHGLAAYYPHPGRDLPLWEIGGAALALVAITATVILGGRRYPYLPVGWFWYLGMLVPVIGLVQVGAQAHADRYTYLPQIGLYAIVAWGFADIVRHWPRCRPLLVAGGTVWLVLLMGCAWWQTRYWRDAETLWRRALACQPESSWIQKALGDVLYDTGRYEESLLHFQRGVNISLNYAGLRLNYGNALYRTSRLAEAQRELEAAVALNPELLDARLSLGVVLYLQGNAVAAIQQFQIVLTRQPDHPAAHSNLGAVLEQQGRAAEAVDHFRRALAANPKFVEAHRNLGRLLLNQGRPAEAIPHLEYVVTAGPGDVRARSDLADALAHTGQLERAIAELQQALARLGPGREADALRLRERLEGYHAQLQKGRAK